MLGRENFSFFFFFKFRLNILMVQKLKHVMEVGAVPVWIFLRCLTQFFRVQPFLLDDFLLFSDISRKHGRPEFSLPCTRLFCHCPHRLEQSPRSIQGVLPQGLGHRLGDREKAPTPRDHRRAREDARRIQILRVHGTKALDPRSRH